jgi:sec-independent protein translocase protein TatB
MLDLGWQELFLITLVALIVVGPKDLPLLIRSITGWIRGARKMAKDFQVSLEEVARETELDSFRKTSDYSFERSISDFVSNELNVDANVSKDEYKKENVINQSELNKKEVTDGFSLSKKPENQVLKDVEVEKEPESSNMDSNPLKSDK